VGKKGPEQCSGKKKINVPEEKREIGRARRRHGTTKKGITPDGVGVGAF